MNRYLFGPVREDGILIHTTECKHLDPSGAYLACPREVLVLVESLIDQGVPYVERPVGLCMNCQPVSTPA